MVWYDYFPQIVAGTITLCVLKISYFFIKRIYTQSSEAYQNATEESDVCESSENLFNESSSESLNLDKEKKMVDINNVTNCSGYGSTEDEFQESKNYTTTQDVSDTCKFNSDSHSSIMSWESCHEGISHSELDFVNCLSLENHPEICQPLNLCTRDKKNETGTNEVTRTFFTDRKHKSIKGIQKKTPKKYLVTKMIEDYDEHTLNNDKLDYNLDNTEQELKNKNKLETTKLSSTYQDKMEDEHNLDYTEQKLKDDNNLEISEISAIHHDELKDEYSLDMTEHELRNKNKLETTKLSSTYQDELEDENNLDNTEPELKDDNNLEISEISAIHHDELKDEYSLDMTEHELRNKNKLETTKLSSTYQDELEVEHNLDYTEQELKDDNNLEISEISAIHNDELKDEYSLDMTEHELRNKNKLETTKLSSTYQDELEDEHNLDNTEQELKDDNNLEISEISSIHHDEYSLDNTEHELRDAHNLEITELSSIHDDEYSLNNTEQELKDDNNLEISELSSKHNEELEDKYSSNNREHSSNDDHVMLANVLETTGLSPIHQDEQKCNIFLTSPELSSLNNDKSISGIDSPNIKFHHDYDEVQDINECCNTCSSECTESFPSPIFNDSLIDDIRYVEDYNDISFFDPTLSDDALNEAFVED